MKYKDLFLRYGIIIGAISILLSVLLHVTGLWTSLWILLPLLAFYAVAAMVAGNAFSKANGREVTFGTVYLSCFKAFCIATVMAAAWRFIEPMVFPNMLAEMLTAARARMENAHRYSNARIELSMARLTANFKYGPLLSLVGNLMGGALLSLIGAAVAKKQRIPAGVSFDSIKY